MDNILCDELIQEIMQRVPPSASSSISLVSKRWLYLHRTSKTSISLRIPLIISIIPSLSSFLSRYPQLSSLTIISDNTSPLFLSYYHSNNQINFPFVSDNLLLCVSSNCSKLRHLRFFAGPVSPSSLLSLSSACKHLTSLTISSFTTLSFFWLTSFPSLKELSFTNFSPKFDEEGSLIVLGEDNSSTSLPNSSSELPLESLCLSGIKAGDQGMGWLWRSCKNLQRLKLKSCEGTGDGASFSSFVGCLNGLQELEIRTCRSIVDGVLLKLAEHCKSLNSLLLYDGGSREGLLQFITRSRLTLQRLDLRLPLDLDNDHLSALAENFRDLVSLRLQSCCLITGEGLMRLASAMNVRLEELALINCDVVEREPGLLTTLGQNLRGLRKLDLSHNEMLVDKEFVSMLVSCKSLVDVKLQGCRALTDVTMVSMFKSCKLLECVDIKQCCRIGAEAVEFFILNSMRLRRVLVEESKLSDVAKTWASQKFIEVG